MGEEKKKKKGRGEGGERKNSAPYSGGTRTNALVLACPLNSSPGKRKKRGGKTLGPISLRCIIIEKFSWKVLTWKDIPGQKKEKRRKSKISRPLSEHAKVIHRGGVGFGTGSGEKGRGKEVPIHWEELPALWSFAKGEKKEGGEVHASAPKKNPTTSLDQREGGRVAKSVFAPSSSAVGPRPLF